MSSAKERNDCVREKKNIFEMSIRNTVRSLTRDSDKHCPCAAALHLQNRCGPVAKARDATARLMCE